MGQSLGITAGKEINVVHLLRTPKLLEYKFVLAVLRQGKLNSAMFIPLNLERAETLLYSFHTNCKVAVN